MTIWRNPFGPEDQRFWVDFADGGGELTQKAPMLELAFCRALAAWLERRDDMIRNEQDFGRAHGDYLEPLDEEPEPVTCHEEQVIRLLIEIRDALVGLRSDLNDVFSGRRQLHLH